jgi:hypothetical protein
VYEVLTIADLGGPEVAIGAMAMAGIIGVLSIVIGATQSMHKTKQREQTKRELAAYVAEGSMTPDEAERLLKAGPDERKAC